MSFKEEEQQKRLDNDMRGSEELQKATFYCANCGKAALVLTLVPAGKTHPKSKSKEKGDVFIYDKSEKPFCIIENDLFKSRVNLKEADLKTFAILLSLEDSIGLYQMNKALLPTFCPQCSKYYCGEHWNVNILFDDGYFDCANGTCPEGHKKTIED